MNERSRHDRFDLADRRVVVTGASRGLGQGLALVLVDAGADVIGVSRSDAGLGETRSQAAGRPGRFTPVPADLTEDAHVDRLVTQMWDDGPLHGVVHCAGIQVRRPAVEVTRDDWSQVTRIHLETPFFLSTALARRQLDEGLSGSHVFIGSLTSWIGLPRIAPYAASKSGILGIVRTLAREWAESDIRVNAVCPGYFRTALTEELFADPERRDQLLSRIPMQRFGVADDLAGAVVFFLSNASAYVTGQTINVDGGWLAG